MTDVAERIVAIELLPLSLELTKYEHSSKLYRNTFTNVCIKLETSSGIVGWGETSGATSGATFEAARAAAEGVAPLLLGGDIFQVEHLRSKVKSAFPPSNHDRLVNMAFAGFDMACWDAVGKCLGRPINELLGGRVRDEVNYFAYCFSSDVNSLTQEAEQAVRDGFRVIYFKIGNDDSRDLQAISAVREAVGQDIAVRVDVNEHWTPEHALTMLRKLEPYGLDFVEGPIDARNLVKMRELRYRTTVPIAGNEFMWSPTEVSAAIAAESCDVVVTGPLWQGGLLPLYQTGAICAATGTGLCLHAPPSSGIAVAAELQVMSTLPRIVDGNQTYHGHLVTDIVSGLDELGDGNLTVPARPGLGVDVDEERLREHAPGSPTRLEL